ncbi:amidohydrolase family protein, partial [Sphingorhabdus sp.]
VDGDRGTVEVGKRADLVLLDANPLANISNIRKIAGVFVNGRWLDRAALDALMADLVKRNEATKADFDFGKMGK